MKIKTMSFMCALMLALTVFYPQPVWAASTFSLLSSGNGGFSLQGEGMENVAALAISITYDTTLSNPRVTAGGLISGALMAVNTKVPGIVRMTIITTSPIKGGGTIVTLAFDRVGNSPGRILAIKASITNSSGNSLPVQTQIVNPPNEPVSASSTPSNVGTQSDKSALPAPAGQPVVIGGPVPSGASVGAKIEEPSAAPKVMPEPVKELEVVSQETASSAPSKEQEVQETKQEKNIYKQQSQEQEVQETKQEKNIYKQQSVLERFRIYKGERSAMSFAELFNQESLIGFRQDPPIVLSDGKATVKIAFIAMPAGKKMPDIKVTGATLLSLKEDHDNTNTWIAETRPDKKAISATLIVSHEKVNMELPIVVAPETTVDLDKSGTVTEADFKEFLRDRGIAQKPLFDCNGDGKRDFMDDYIFTANYVIKRPVTIE